MVTMATCCGLPVAHGDRSSGIGPQVCHAINGRCPSRVGRMSAMAKAFPDYSDSPSRPAQVHGQVVAGRVVAEEFVAVSGRTPAQDGLPLRPTQQSARMAAVDVALRSFAATLTFKRILLIMRNWRAVSIPDWQIELQTWVIYPIVWNVDECPKHCGAG
jgi:hypothetical protein